jgi:hypothetical protein
VSFAWRGSSACAPSLPQLSGNRREASCVRSSPVNTSAVVTESNVQKKTAVLCPRAHILEEAHYRCIQRMKMKACKRMRKARWAAKRCRRIPHWPLEPCCQPSRCATGVIRRIMRRPASFEREVSSAPEVRGFTQIRDLWMAKRGASSLVHNASHGRARRQVVVGRNQVVHETRTRLVVL